MAQEPGTVLEGPEAEQAAAQPPPAETEEEPSLEALTIEREGKKLVPLEEVATLREKRRADKAKLDELAKQNETLTQWKSYGEQAQPIIEALKARPDIIEAIQSGEVPAATTTEEDQGSDELKALATSLDLYDKAGRPDVGRAKTIGAFIHKAAQDVARAEVEPLAKGTAKDRSDLNFNRMAQFKGEHGQTIDRETLQAVWQLFPAEQTQDEGTSKFLMLAAAGLKYLTGDGTAPPPERTEPLVVEPAGGRAGGPVKLTPHMRETAKDMGVNESDFAKGVQTVMDNQGVLE